MVVRSEVRIYRNDEGKLVLVWLSAVSGEGIDLLFQAITELLVGDIFHEQLSLAPEEGGLCAQLYAHGAVLNEAVDDQGIIDLEVRIQKKDLLQLLSRMNIAPERYLGANVKKPEWLHS